MLVFDTEILEAVESLTNHPKKWDNKLWDNRLPVALICIQLREAGVEHAVDEYDQVSGRLELYRRNFLINHNYLITEKGRETLAEWKERDAKTKGH